ncbi:hypothetical protein QWY86_19705 [Pedobacter aquatilis]|uniref:hypothetical protein n=1 Tax=Pedobacter aquatilis TaxID=351343 RepID=UPI0025B29D08|nr:hypothetical protein [Pedobacter aquatilis]MDN3588913.1 hypothetical protein [Pedobacter aquatilis]
MTNQEISNSSKLRIYVILFGTAIILSIPLIAMQFTNEVNWSLFDFVVAAVLLLCTGFAIELVIRKVKTTTTRAVLFFIILLVLFLVWAELAVGIFGSPIAGS